MMRLEELKLMMVNSSWDSNTLELAIRAKFKCEYCGCDFYSSVNNYESIQRDHIIPQKHGGDDSFENLALVCRTCNFIKKNWNPVKTKGNSFTRDEILAITIKYILAKRRIKEDKIITEKILTREILAYSR